MASISDLRSLYDQARCRQAFDTLPRFGKSGLILGRGTLLAREGGADRDADRLMVLLSTAYDRRVSPIVLKYVKRAFGHWQRGDAVLAHIELAFARLPRLESENSAFALFLAEALLDDGLAPHDLAQDLGVDLRKYDPSQPRVPAGSGRESGRWGPGSGSSTSARTNLGIGLLGEATAETTGRSLLVDTSPGIVRALAAFATRFSVPTAVLGALFIPTPNSGGVTEGTLPDAPDINYRRDGPAGTLRLMRREEDGTEAIVVAQNRRGIYVDTATNAPLGRDFGGQFYLDLDVVVAALAPRDRPRDEATDDEPQLCPAPVKDAPHDPKEHTLDYEDDVHRRVNPLAPIPRGFAIRIIDPLTGEAQYPEDCFRYAGDLVDGDMKPGDFADAKGEEYSRLLSIPRVQDDVMAKLVDVTTRHFRAARALGSGLKVYFAEQDAADRVRAYFAGIKDLQGVVVGYLPPSKPKQRGRSR